MTITLAQLQSIIPNAGPRAGVFHGPLVAAMDEFGIDTPVRAAAFIAQIAHESASLQAVSENLNYSADALLRVFPRYFTVDEAQRYSRNPERIASRVYANRMGNGPEASGDGWTYRGAGLIQTTGKTNQFAVADHFGIDRGAVGQWLRTPEGAARSAAYFWSTNRLNALADVGDIRAITRKINGGLNGLEDRLAFYERAKQALGA